MKDYVGFKQPAGPRTWYCCGCGIEGYDGEGVFMYEADRATLDAYCVRCAVELGPDVAQMMLAGSIRRRDVPKGQFLEIAMLIAEKGGERQARKLIANAVLDVIAESTEDPTTELALWLAEREQRPIDMARATRFETMEPTDEQRKIATAKLSAMFEGEELAEALANASWVTSVEAAEANS